MSDNPLTGVRFIPSAAGMKRAGLRAIQLIRTRTLKGQGLDGPFAGYGVNPFALPAGALTGQARAALKGRLHYFKKPSGRLWVVVEGGYKAYKQARYPQDGGNVNLSATGAMLRAMTVTKVDGDTIQIGFTRQEEAEKAYWHNVTGAGKRRVIRRFMGLLDQEKEELAKIIGADMQLKA